MKPFRFKIMLRLKTPFLIQAAMGGAFGIDALLLRDGQGNPYLPGDSLVGKLREAWRDLGRVSQSTFETKADKWLGHGSNTADDAPQSRGIKFEDLKLIPDPTQSLDPRSFITLPRIEIDDDRHGVKRGMLMLAEQPCRPGREIEFAGECYGYVEDLNEFRRCLIAGLRWIPQIGAGRTIGFGRIVAVKIEDLSPRPVSAATIIPSCRTRIGLRLMITEPFCVAKRRVVNNIFESEEIIPGGAIKGAVAFLRDRHSGRYLNLERHFDKIIIRHAVPSRDSNKRAIVPPLSLVKVKTGGVQRLFDVARFEKPVLINGTAPAFQIDWKEFDGLDHYGRGSINRRLQVRTAIDPTTLRADNGKLFAYESIDPDATVWLSEVLLPEDDSVPSNALQELELLLCGSTAPSGLKFLGKTDARAEVQFISDLHAAQPSDPQPQNGRWIITLQSPALLCDPESFGDLKNSYERVWLELSDGLLKMSLFYASQSLAGGGYLYRRFMDISKLYRPFLLTDAGSVFVLKLADKVDQNKAIDKVKAWLRNGLPLPKWAECRYKHSGKPLWQTCPYLPENGYGEIAVNLPDHKKLSQDATFTEQEVIPCQLAI